MSVKKDTIKTVVIIDGKQGINELGKIEMQANDIIHSMKGMKKKSDDYVAASAKLKGVRETMKKLREQMGLNGMTLNQLTRYQKDLYSQIRLTATKGTAAYKKLERQYKSVTKAVNKQRDALRGTGGVWKSLTKSIKGFGVLALTYLGADMLISQLDNLILGAARLSDQMSDVQKTTDLTDKELGRLMKRFKSFDTRLPKKELLGLAEEAGRLGKRGVSDIEGFVRSAAKIKVSLGDDLGGDANANIRTIGKLTEQYKVAERTNSDYEKSLDRVGSAINEVSANGSNQATFLVDYIKRLVGISKQTTINIQEQIGFAATFDELGQSVEVAGTVMNKLTANAFKDTSTFAKIANIDVAQYSDLLKNDTNEAMILFLEGLNGNNEGLTEMSKKLDELGLDGSKAIGVLAAISSSTEKLRDKQLQANKALLEGTSLTEEYNKKNNNLAGSLAKVQKFIASKFINSDFVNWLGSVVGKMTEWIKVPLSETLYAHRISMNALATQAFSLNEESDEYRKILTQLKNEYPEYLSQIETDRTTHEGLVDILKQANDQLIKKIAIQKLDEAHIESATKASEKLIERDMARSKLALDLQDKADKQNMSEKLLGKTLEEQVAIMDKRNQTSFAPGGVRMQTYQDQLDGITSKTKEYEAAALEAAKAQEILNGVRDLIKFEDDKPTTDPVDSPSGVVPTTPFTAAVDPKEVKKAYEAGLQAFDNGQALLIEQLRAHLLERKIEQETFNQEMQALELATLEAKRSFAQAAGESTLALDQQINDLSFNMAQDRISKTQQTEKESADFAEHLVDQEIAALIEADQIKDALAEKEKKRNQEFAEAKLQEAEAAVMAASMSAAAAVDNAETSEEAAVAIINNIRDIIKAKMQEAIAYAVAKEMASKGLLGLITGALAVGAATLFFNKLLPPVKTKSQKQEGRSFFHGGDTGNEDLGIGGDKHGAFAGYVHRQEFVIPGHEQNDPYVLNTKALLEARNPQMKKTVNPATLPSVGGMTGEQADIMIGSLKQLIQSVNDPKNPQQAFVVFSEFEAKQREYDKAKGPKL